MAIKNNLYEYDNWWLLDFLCIKFWVTNVSTIIPPASSERAYSKICAWCTPYYYFTCALHQIVGDEKSSTAIGVQSIGAVVMWHLIS